MAHLESRPGNKFLITYYENGVRKRIYLKGITKQEAKRQKRLLENELRIKQQLSHQSRFVKLSLSEYRVFYQKKRGFEVEVGSLSKDTLKRQLYALDLFIQLLGDKSLTDLSKSDLEKFIEWRAKSISPRGVNHDLSDLKTVLRFAYKKGLIQEPFFDRVSKIKTIKKLPEILEPDEIDRIEACVSPAVAQFAFRFIKLSGVRRTEVTRIKWKHITDKYVRVPIAKNREERIIPLHKKLREVVEARKTLINPDPEDRIVPLHPDTLTQYFKAAMRMAGINKKGSVHILRHSLGYYLASNGFDINAIAQFLGHKTLAMAMLYSRIAKESLRARLDEIM